MEFLSPRDADKKFEEFIAEVDQLRKARGYVPAGNRVFILQFDTTNLCNLQCRQCNVYLIRDVVHATPMTPELLQKAGKEIFPYCGDINFSALAEPLLSPVIEEALRLAKEDGVPFRQMISNALLLTEKRARMLIDLEVNRLSVSLDAVTQETYTKIRGADLGKVIRNVERLRDMKEAAGATKPQIMFNFVMNRLNLEEMPGFVDLAKRLGGEVLDFRLPFFMKRQNLDNELPTTAPELMDEMIEKTKKRAEELEITLEQIPETNAARAEQGYETPPLNSTPGPLEGGMPHCDVPWAFLLIGPTGDVYPCCSAFMLGGKPIGNLGTHSFAQIITGPGHSGLRKQLIAGELNSACTKCKSTDYLNAYELDASCYRDCGPRLPIAGDS